MLLFPARCTVGMPWLPLTWHGGLWRPFLFFFFPPLLILVPAGPPAPLGLCWHYLGWRDGETGGKLKLSWKQMTCVRLVVGMGVAMETASPNSILHPTPDAQLP